jgi:hypothetical protein
MNIRSLLSFEVSSERSSGYIVFLPPKGLGFLARSRVRFPVRAPTGYSGVTVELPQPHGGTLRPFKPGQSGNPSGRPKGAAKAFREAMPDPTLAAQGLLELAQDPDVRPADRISAWNSLLDRGYGKAASFAAIEGADPLEQDEVAAEIRSIAAQLEADRAA